MQNEKFLKRFKKNSKVIQEFSVTQRTPILCKNSEKFDTDKFPAQSTVSQRSVYENGKNFSVQEMKNNSRNYCN